MRIPCFFAALIVTLSAALLPAAETNPVMKELLDTGIPIGTQVKEKLPPPTMPDGLSAEAQKKLIESLTDEGHPYEELMRKSVQAPFIQKVTGGKRPVDTQYRRCDIYFIAYGDLDTVADRGFLKEQVEAEKKEAEEAEAAGKKKKKDELPSKTYTLNAQELLERNLKVENTPTTRESYIHAEVGLFNKVIANGTARAFQIRTEESVLGCASMDPRFNADKKFPNQWQKVVTDPTTGKRTIEAPLPYFGMGAYVKATRLKNPDGALFVEYHLVYNEPDAWFNGANLLASKLPIAAKDGIPKFRTNLLKAAKEKGVNKAAQK